MKAVVIPQPGGPEVLRLADVPDPVPSREELLVRVRATALNRADILQRMGRYPPPPGESEIPGLEIAGEVEEAGEAVHGFVPGDKVFALVSGGGYASQVTVDYRMAMKVPSGWSFREAAAVPEAFFTAQETLFTHGRLQAAEAVLIHAAGSGVGTASIQMARYVGARVLVTAGTMSKIQQARRLGAEEGCNYKEQDFSDWILRLTASQGVHLIQDPIGSSYWEQNIRCLREEGRLVILGLMGGAKADVNLRTIITKRLTIVGTVLRNRSIEDKIAIRKRFEARWLPLLSAGTIRPVVDTVFPLEQAAEAHRYLEANRNIGKVVLEVGANR